MFVELSFVCAIGKSICDTPIQSGQRGVTTPTNFGNKIAINAFLQEIGKTVYYIHGPCRDRNNFYCFMFQLWALHVVIKRQFF